MSSFETTGNIDTAIKAGITIAGAGPQVPTPSEGTEAIPYVIVPSGATVQSLAAQYVRELPRRRSGAVSLADAASFIAYVSAFKLSETRIFANPADNIVTAVFDYHQPGEDGQPRWGAHRATLTMAFTEAWTRWTDQDGKKVDQLVFAEFIENNLQDIADPDGSTILQVSRSLEATKEVGFKSATRLSDGQTQFAYNEVLAATAQVDERRMEIPERFVLGIIPFDGDTELYRLTARLRYRIANGGKLTIGYDLLRPDLVEEDARKKTLETIGAAIGLPILRGIAPAPLQ